MEHTIALTLHTIRQSELLLKDTDLTIARWRSLGCNLREAGAENPT